nr:MAG TPA: hypothetical protein [Caudoviricetes sp.]
MTSDSSNAIHLIHHLDNFSLRTFRYMLTC